MAVSLENSLAFGARQVLGRGFPMVMVRNLLASAGDIRIWVRSLGGEDPLEEGMAIHSSILAWRIPWTEEPGGLQSMGSHRLTTKGNLVRARTHTHTHTGVGQVL